MKKASDRWDDIDPGHHVYILIDPRTGMGFYVGCTSQPRDRFRAHHSSYDLLVRERLQAIEATKLKPVMYAPFTYTDRAEALR